MGIPVALRIILPTSKRNLIYTDTFAQAGHAGTSEIMVAMHFYLHENEQVLEGARPCFERAISFHKTHPAAGIEDPPAR